MDLELAVSLGPSRLPSKQVNFTTITSTKEAFEMCNLIMLVNEALHTKQKVYSE